MFSADIVSTVKESNMRISGPKLLTALAFSVLGALPSTALELSKEQQKDTYRFAANNSLFILYHEVAHLLFDKLELPVLGREEDAADNLATWTLLNKHTAQAKQALTDAAQGWQLSGVAYGSGTAETDFYDTHSLDKQRAYAIVCLMVGSDGNAYRPIANQYRMERGRQDSCQWDYDMVDRSLTSVLAAHSHRPEGTDVTVSYHDAGGRLKPAAEAFRRSGVFDQVAEELRTHYHLEEKVEFTAKRCGEANAFYDMDTVEVIFCYELMQDYMDLYTDTLAESPADADAVGSEKLKIERS